MYRDLLTQALRKGEEGRRSDDLLLADLVDSRARLQATGGAAPVAEALARELSYDGALIRLCASLDVRATPAWFDCPGGSGPGWSASSSVAASCFPHHSSRTLSSNLAPRHRHPDEDARASELPGLTWRARVRPGQRPAAPR